MTKANDAYHADLSAYSRTAIKLFRQSHCLFDLVYNQRALEPPSPKSVQTFVGSAVHDILLEGVLPSECLAVYPDDCFKRSKSTGEIVGLNPKPAAEFRDANPDKIVVKSEVSLRICEIVLSVNRHSLGNVLKHTAGGEFEKALYATDPLTGLPIKCKPDWFADMGDFLLSYDLKVSERPSPPEWRRVARQQCYWLQQVHYSHIMQTLFGKPVDYVFWVIEAKPPYRIAPYKYPQSFIDEAWSTYRLTLDALKRCIDTGDWEDDWTKQINIVETSPYELDGGEELQFGGSSDDVEEN